MSLWGNKPSTPPPNPRPGVPTPGKIVTPWSSKPASKPSAQPVKPGFMENRFRKQDELVNEVKKQNYFKNIPTYGKKFTQKERVDLIKRIEKVGGAPGGLSDQRMNIAIKKMEKEKMMASIHKDFNRAKKLDQEIKQAKVWKKTW
jgi:hypothetical protein